MGQWSDMVTTLAGACGHVVTVVGGATGDPHDYEPTTSGAALLTRADLVVVNGLGYDDWAVHVLDTLRERPRVVDAGEAAGFQEGDNPHIWYGPRQVGQVADAVTAALEDRMPAAAQHLRARREAWAAATRPLTEAVESLRHAAAGRTFVATESVFELMADALGLVDRTPPGYRAAVANETDPAPGDVYALDETLRSGSVDVLVYNSQTESALSLQARRVATDSGVPVVVATETEPDGAGGFVQWQMDQLDSLAQALGVG